MSELKPYDDTQEPDEDSYETPPDLYARLCKNYRINPQLDAAARSYNRICLDYLDDALHQEWLANGHRVDVWCNPPHSLNEAFVRRADQQHRKHNINIMMIIPTNCQSAQFWHDLIEDEHHVKTENHPILKRPRFLKNHKPTGNGSRNAYRVIIWRKQ